MSTTVLIDARPLQGPDANRGVGRYVRSLLTGLDQISWSGRVTLLLDVDLPAGEIPGGFASATVKRRYRGRLAALEDSAVLARDLDRVRPAVFHSPWLRLPSRAPCPVVVTLHDLIPWAWGRPWMVGERFRHYAGKRLLRRAEGVIAVSEATAADAITYAGVDRDRLSVIHEGVDPGFAPLPGAAERVARRWGVVGPFLLYVGALDRRKDPVGLVRAWRAAQRAGVECELVIAGDPGAQAPGHMGGARLLGHVSDAELKDLYRAAACFVFPSRYEGFGLPALEAMACGCPVVAYDNSSLPEVVGEAGVLVSDGDARALGCAAAEIVLAPERRSELVALGVRRAATFSWERTARETIAVYRKLL